MTTNQNAEIDINQAYETERTPAGADLDESAGGRQRDLFLPSLFISITGVLLLLGFPIHVDFQPQRELSIALALLGAAVVWFGTLTRRMPILYSGVGLVLAVAAVAVVTQPSLLSVPVTAIWPARVSMVLLVAVIWIWLMRPPAWLERATLGFLLSTILLLVLWGGPATGASLFGWSAPVTKINFAPNFLAIDSHNTLYASSPTNGLIWVFDESGSPRGTLRPGSAPPVPTPGPGILPNGMEEELGLTRRPSTGVAAPVGVPLTPFYVCGIAVDSQDNIYTVDANDVSGPKLLRFDRDGIITSRLALPESYAEGFFPGPNCLEVDDEHIYLSTFIGKLDILDREAHLQHSVALPERAIDFTVMGDGDLVVLGSAYFERIDVESGTLVTSTLPLPPDHQRIPYGAIVADGDHEVLVTDMASQKILRIDLESNKIVDSFGGTGFQPGQLVAPAGMAIDKQGRVYVADGQHRVIERFTREGKIDSLLWAALSFPEGPQQSVEID
jgi:hypothetical protein